MPTTSAAAGAAAIDEELVKKLLGGESTAVDAVESMLQNMQRAADRLAREHETGRDTQQIQSQIVSQLDELIKQASQGGGSQSSKKSRQKSRRPGGQRDAKSGPPRAGEGARSDRDQPQLGPEHKGQTEPAGREGGDRADLSRRWGFLPDQERAEIAQGFDEAYLPRFREHIRRYYLKLAAESQSEVSP